MDRKALLDNFAREAREKGVFTGTWLFAENGQIVSKGAIGWRDPDDEAGSSEVVTCDGMNGDGLVHSSILDLFM